MNTARRRLGRDLRESVTARDGKLEWRLLIDRPRRGPGPIEVELRRPPRGADRLRLDRTFTIEDRSGRRLFTGTANVLSDRLLMRAPVVGAPAYPLTLGLDVGVEHAVSDPLFVPDYHSQENPAAAWNGSEYLVVWEEYVARFTTHLYGARVTPEGEILDPGAIPISVDEDQQFGARVSSDGSSFVVVFSHSHPEPATSAIEGIRVGANGTLLDPAPFPITRRGENPALEFDGANYLVVWKDYQEAPGQIYGTRVGTDGTVLDPEGFQISFGTGHPYWSDVAWDGSRFLVVWDDYAISGNTDVRGARVTADGVVLDPNGIAISGARHSGGPLCCFEWRGVPRRLGGPARSGSAGYLRRARKR